MKKKLVEKSLENFRQGEGLNCAQSVSYAFEEIFTSEGNTKALHNCGGGNVADGVCGSIYAAGEILEEEHFNELKDDFNKKAGSIKCREILKNKKISCQECVQASVEFIHDNKINKI